MTLLFRFTFFNRIARKSGSSIKLDIFWHRPSEIRILRHLLREISKLDTCPDFLTYYGNLYGDLRGPDTLPCATCKKESENLVISPLDGFLLPLDFGLGCDFFILFLYKLNTAESA
jgi:hypothetical protein